ncbi:MAG: gluconokinase [Rubritalea sp.]|jgi:gluconokinase
MKQNIIIMGVSGCGKSTIGVLLADELGTVFYDGDDFHPQSSLDKLASGIPLNDDDRKPWLETLVSNIRETSASSAGSVTACSALKKSHRDILRAAGDVTFVYLKGTEETILARLIERSNSSDHFMPSSLLESQLRTLEEPIEETDTITISTKDSPQQIISNILNSIAGR